MKRTACLTAAVLLVSLCEFSLPGALAQPAYPRIVSIMDEIVGGHAPRMNQSWRAIVQDITEDAP